jgi:hypothetical protein
MRGAGDIKDKAIVVLKPDPRAIAHGPAAQSMLKPSIRHWVCGAALQIRAKGARVGKGHANTQAKPFSCTVQTINPVGIALGKRQREWPLDGTHP